MRRLLTLLFLGFLALCLDSCTGTNKVEDVDRRHYYALGWSDYNPLQKYKDYPMYRLTSSYRYYPIAFVGENIIFFDGESSFTNLHISNTNVDLGDPVLHMSSTNIEVYINRKIFIPSPSTNSNIIFFATINSNIVKIGYYNINNTTMTYLREINLDIFRENQDCLPVFLSLSPNGKYYIVQTHGYSNITVGNLTATGTLYFRLRFLNLENDSLIKSCFSPLDSYLPLIDDKILFAGMSFSEDDSKICFFRNSYHDIVRVYNVSDLDTPVKSYSGRFDKVIWNSPYLLCIERNPIRLQEETNLISGRGVVIINLQNDNMVTVGNKSYETHSPFFKNAVFYLPIVLESHAILSPDRKKLILKIDPNFSTTLSYDYNNEVELAGGVKPSDIIGTWIIDISSLGL